MGAKAEESHTTTFNGKEETISTKAEFSVKTIQNLEKPLVHQCDEKGQLIDTQELSVSGNVQDILWASHSAWAVVEEHYPDHVQRTAYDYPTDGSEEVQHIVIILNDENIGEASTIYFKSIK